jgi:type VI secretion system ImpA family protein
MKRVVDIKGLLEPIPGDNPAGQNLRYSVLYDEIREARWSEDILPQGVWVREVKVADWGQVERLAISALANDTKDLQVSAWLTEALVRLYGYVGLRDGLELVRNLHERYWDGMYPEIDDGDLEARAKSLSWLDSKLAVALKELPVTQTGTGLEYSFLDYETGRVTGWQTAQAVTLTRWAFYKETSARLDECREEFQKLDRVVQEKYAEQGPALRELAKSLSSLRSFIQKVLADRVQLEPESSEASVLRATAEALDTAAEPIAPAEVCFTAYCPMEITPGLWETLLVYAHLPGAVGAVYEDSGMLLGPHPQFHRRHGAVATNEIQRGAEITVVPEMPGCRFNPPRASFLWLEDWHRIEFRLLASQDLPGFKWGEATNGRVAFYVGPVLVAEVKCSALFSTGAGESSHPARHFKTTGNAYHAIFVSYSQKDAYIVEQLERAYIVLGLDYMRDLTILRTGEEWNPQLLRKIEEADIFQLCWSIAAKESRYVEQEWRHALDLHRPHFIRPVYWEMPLPEPPLELKNLHFARLNLLPPANIHRL